MAKKRIQNLLKHVVCILLCLCVVLPFYMVLINSFKTKAEAENLTAEDGKAIVIDETLADDDAMSYDMDLEDGEWGLSDYVKKGIEVLDNDTGFFMMVEGGKIDWACHANDAAATITDTVAMDEAVGKAVDFYNEHPDETLILVTGDHETGGLTIGFAGTDYDISCKYQ